MTIFAKQPASRLDVAPNNSLIVQKRVHLNFANSFSKPDQRHRSFDQESMRRAALERLGETPTIEVLITTPEFSMTGIGRNETSDGQWDDVTRVLASI